MTDDDENVCFHYRGEVERETRVKRSELTDKIEQILRSRTYDRHPEDEDEIEELLDEDG